MFRNNKFISLLLSFFVIGSLFIFIKPASAFAATYYVSTAGNDTTGDGSNGTPWLTLQKAETAASTGDTVNILAGTYRENEAVTHAWKVAKGIAWVGQGAVTVRGTSTATRVLDISGTNSASFTNITFDSEATRAGAVLFNSGAQNKTFTGCTFQGATSITVNMVAAGTNVTISNSTFTVTAGDAFRFGNWDNLIMNANTFNVSGTRVFVTSTAGGTFTFSNNTVTGSATSVLFNIAANGIYNITGNTISVTGTTPLIMDTVVGTGTLNFLNNTITMSAQITAESLRINSGTWTATFKGNSITSTNTSQARDIIYIKNQIAPDVENNTIDTLSSGNIASINILTTATGGGGNPIIKNNTIKTRSTSGYGIAVGSEGTTTGDNVYDGAIVEGNTVYGALYYDPSLTLIATHSIFYGYNKNGFIRYNTVIGGGYCIVIKGGGMVWSGGGVYYNKCINSDSTASIRVKGVKNLPLYNNTISVDPNFDIPFGAIYITQNNIGEFSGGTNLKNNIIKIGTNAAAIRIESGSETGFTSNYNLFYRSSGTNIGMIGASSYTMSQWQGLGYDTNSIYADPLFTDSSSYDFTLQSSSPAINAGIDVGLTRDFIGTLVPQGSRQDIGALEYISSNSSNANSRSVSAPSCGNTKPQNSPQLFQINTTNKNATLYFSPSGNNTNAYVISYGYDAKAEQFAVEFNYGNSETAIRYTINELEHNKTYYFKVRGGNGCMPGEWSNSLKATTVSANNTSSKIFTAWEQMKDIVKTWLPT